MIRVRKKERLAIVQQTLAIVLPSTNRNPINTKITP
jgi:hypothetical protein